MSTRVKIFLCPDWDQTLIMLQEAPVVTRANRRRAEQFVNTLDDFEAEIAKTGAENSPRPTESVCVHLAAAGAIKKCAARRVNNRERERAVLAPESSANTCV